MNGAPPILLTGAGFTRDFGGYLFDEMFALIQTEVRSDQALLALLKDLLDYEEWYDQVVGRGIGFGETSRALAREAMLNAHVRLDDSIRMRNVFDRIDLVSLIRFLGRFVGEERQYGYWFTLNQDLFVERNLIGNGAAPLRLAGGISATSLQSATRPVERSDLVVLDSNDHAYRAADERPERELLYVKFHGSLNWQSAADPRAMVIGRGTKSATIQNEPLLAYYLELFERALCQPDRRLCVIGYSFRDEHINDIIARGGEHHGLRLFVVSPQSP